jgi:hypothetical protein
MSRFARTPAALPYSFPKGCPDPDLAHLADRQAKAATIARRHAHHLLGTFDAITSEPKDVVRSDAGVPVVPLLQEASQDMLVVLPARDEVGIFMHLVRRQLKGFGNACGIARAQRATAIDAHQLRSSPVDGNLLHTAQRFFA